MSGELRQRSQIQGDPDCQTNHPCQHQRKCVEDSLKNTNVRVLRVMLTHENVSSGTIIKEKVEKHRSVFKSNFNFSLSVQGPV